jgi:hypothetical protein
MPSGQSGGLLQTTEGGEVVATRLTDMEPGDYVKVGPDQYKEVASVYGVHDGRLGRPSEREDGYGVMTTDGCSVGMMSALSYHKKQDVDSNGKPKPSRSLDWRDV